jgi:hypothetical protein
MPLPLLWKLSLRLFSPPGLGLLPFLRAVFEACRLLYVFGGLWSRGAPLLLACFESAAPRMKK